MASFTINIEGGSSFSCADDQYILDAAEEQGIDPPIPAVLVPAAPAQAKSLTEALIRLIKASWMTTKCRRALLCFA